MTRVPVIDVGEPSEGASEMADKSCQYRCRLAKICSLIFFYTFIKNKPGKVQSTQMPSPFGLCSYGNNIWMHKFQQLFSKCSIWSVILFYLTPPRSQSSSEL